MYEEVGAAKVFAADEKRYPGESAIFAWWKSCLPLAFHPVTTRLPTLHSDQNSARRGWMNRHPGDKFAG